MYCGKCGYLMKKTDMFCPYCGMSVQTTKKVSRSGNAAAMPKPRKNAYCGSCGYPIKNTDMFCPYCGMGAQPSISMGYGRGVGRMGNAVVMSKPKKKWLAPLIAILIACAILFSIIGIVRRIFGSGANSPEDAIEAYYELLADGDFEGMADLIPKEKQEILLEAFVDMYGSEDAPDDIDEAFKEYGEWLENHTDNVEDDRYYDNSASYWEWESYWEDLSYYYYDYGDSVWKDLVPGLDDYEIYKCGSVSVKVKDEEEADLADLLETNWGFDYSSEKALLNVIEDSGSVDEADSDDVIALLDYDKLVECKTTIEPKSGHNVTQDVYAYKVDGKWYCANVLLYFCDYVLEA